MEAGLDLKSLKAGSLVPVVAGLMMLAALWMAWGGWQLFSSSRLEKATADARQNVAGQLQPMLGTLLEKSGTLRGRVALINALEANDTAAARAVVLDTVPGTEAVEFHAVDLAEAYANPEAFGYGKLGLLERALQEDRAALAVVKDGGGARVGIAVPVVSEGATLRLAYLRQPLAPLLAVTKDAAPSGAYLALRQGGYNVVESGVIEELKFRAEDGAVKLSGTGLRVVAVAPPALPGLFDLHGLGEFGIALLLAAVAAGPVLAQPSAARPANSRRRPRRRST